MTKVEEIIKNIKDNLTQASSNNRDEIKVATAMLNDRSYSTKIYNSSTGFTDYCPAVEVRKNDAITISNATGITNNEAIALLDKYDYSEKEAKAKVQFGKEFILTYIDTGRKLPLGAKPDSNIAIIGKTVEAGTHRYPKVVGVDDNGKKIVESSEVYIPSYKTIRAIGPCPVWLKESENKK